MLLKVLRPEQVTLAADTVVTSVFGEAMLNRPESQLQEVVEQEAGATSPLMLCSTAGHDASGKVDSLASAVGIRLRALAMGSADGFATAESYIATAVKVLGLPCLLFSVLCECCVPKRCEGLGV
jgi:dynein heavy chain 1